jgi:3-oxoacyl-[acyl-carrier-protein] synthase II
MESMEAFGAGVITEGVGGANPAVFPNTVYNAAGGQVAIKVGAHGSASTVTAGHAAGASSLCYGGDLVATNHADAVICLGADALTDTVVAAYTALGVLAANGGSGLRLSEAGVALLVERLGRARERGADVYGQVAGYGITSDAMGVGHVDPEGDGVERAMRVALERAGLDPGDVAAVWAGRCGLDAFDDGEAKAIERLLGPEAKVIAPKLLLGDPMGAGASMCAALALEGWRRGDADRSPVGPVLVNSGSLGGTNFSIVLTPPEA